MTTLTPDLPILPGFTVRLYRGEGDVPALRDVLQAERDAGGVAGGFNLAGLLNFYCQPGSGDAPRDMLLVEGLSGLVAFGRVWWQVEGSSQIYLYRLAVHVRPEAQGQGLGRALLAWLEARALAVAAEQGHPRHPAGAAFWQAEDNHSPTAKTAVLTRAGYTLVRDYSDMVRPALEAIPDRRLPAGLELRAVRPEHYAAIWRAKAEGLRERGGTTEPTAADYARWVGDEAMFQPDIWKVAWDPATKEIVGMVLGNIDVAENEESHRRRGYTDNIGVHPSWRRRGVASALITASLCELKARGMTEAALTVESDNTPALNAYLALGYRPELRVVVYRKPIPSDQ